MFSRPEKRQLREHARRYDYYLTTATMTQVVSPVRQPFEVVDAAWVPVAELNKKTAGQDVLEALASWKPLR
jgi:hypothetical protein